MKRLALAMALAVLFILTIGSFASAALIDNGDGTITDPGSQLMWLKDANYSATWKLHAGYGITPDGKMNWWVAEIWADELVYAGYDDWRLPTSDNCTRFHCENSEMGHLYFTELGNKVYIEGGWTPPNFEPFVNIKNDYYWSNTAYESFPGQIYTFQFNRGQQETNSVYYEAYVIPVRDTGPIAPEPVSSILFLTGGTALWLRKKLKK